ncbi:hypothetical protein SAMN04244572_04675 [Azotobacter beijerinckii]|uniref:Uncharacterized protein n=1 Tax=Azotobacter beijerinckii TaxID=170623 RepID=A0A1H9SJ27_9GAMM|nr:hypothetical protein [Azotobacter beijerinckii]SEJ61933.1 hypothetical protein SAMN04244572_04675 [Azotobacter beijerinckii]SER84957.1 hypothetical protein SAMN04244573_04447 [Azotobacter beijerinckii]
MPEHDNNTPSGAQTLFRGPTMIDALAQGGYCPLLVSKLRWDKNAEHETNYPALKGHL